MDLFSRGRTVSVPAPISTSVGDLKRLAVSARVARETPKAFANGPVVARRPFSYESVEDQKKADKVESAWSIGSLFFNRLWPVELARMSISSTAREHNYDRYLTPEQRQMQRKGYRLFINPVIAGDLNEFVRLYSESTMTGVEIRAMAEAFDAQFTPTGDFGKGSFFTFLVEKEWPLTKKTFKSGSRLLYTAEPIGGMRGGGYNKRTGKMTGSYWGITQFSAGTYDMVQRKARGWGLDLPARREDMTFGAMLVASYVLALMGQPYMIASSVDVNPLTIYVSHNQGFGVWQNKTIPSSFWDGQSASAKGLLRKYGIAPARDA